MDIGQYIDKYEHHSKATIYRIGFRYYSGVYYVDIATLPKAWVYIDTTSKGCIALRLYISREVKQALIKSGLAVYVMPYNRFTKIKGYNNGVKFEGYIWRKYKHTYHKDSNAFYSKPDITLNGIGYQLKWQNATIVKIDTLDKLS
jgi:hypothetical protein